MRSSAILLIASALSLASAAEKSVRTIHIEGAGAFSERELLDLMTLRAGMTLSTAQLSRDLELIARHYRGNGYIFSQLRADTSKAADDSSALTLRLPIHEGVRPPISRITIAGRSAFT